MENNKASPSPIYLAVARRNFGIIDSLLEWTKVTPEMLNYADKDGATSLLELLTRDDKEYSFYEKWDKEELAIRLVDAGADVLHKMKARYYSYPSFGGVKESYSVINVAIVKNKEKFFSYLVKNNKITKQDVMDSFSDNPFLYAQANKASGQILELLKELGIDAPDPKEAWKNITGMSQLEYLKTQEMPLLGFDDALMIIKSVASHQKILPAEKPVLMKEILNIFKQELTKEHLKELKRKAPDILFPLINNTDEKTFRTIFDFAGKPFLSKNSNGEDFLLASLKASKLRLGSYFLSNLGLQEYNKSGETAALTLFQMYGFGNKEHKIFKSILEKGASQIDFTKKDLNGYNLLHDFYLKKTAGRTGKYFHYLSRELRTSLLGLVNTPDNNGLTPLMHLCISQDINSVRELLDDCSRFGVKVDYFKKDKDDISVLAYMFLLYKHDHTDTFKGKEAIKDVLALEEIKDYVDKSSEHEASALLLQTMMLSAGSAFKCSNFVMNNNQVFARMNLFLDMMPHQKIDASLAVKHWQGFMNGLDPVSDTYSSYSVIRYGNVEPNFLFLLNDKINQKEKDMVLETIDGIGLRGRSCMLELLNMIANTEKIVLPLHQDFMSKYKDDVDFWAKLEKINLKNKIFGDENKSVKRLKI